MEARDSLGEDVTDVTDGSKETLVIEERRL
jgi:hypothetical protein